MANTTRRPRRRRKAAIRSGSVVTGSPSSEVCSTKSSSPGDALVRADREVVERLGGVGAPLAQRLRQQRQRGHQDQGPLAVKPLGDPHRGQRLAGPAGHDQLAPVGALEALDRRPDRLLDVREGLLAGRAARAQIVGRLRATRPAQAQAASGAGSRPAPAGHRAFASRSGRAGRWWRSAAGRRSRGGSTRQERVNVGLLDRVARGRTPSPGSPRGRRRVPRRRGRFRRQGPGLRPVRPEPDLAEPAPVLRCVPQVPGADALELASSNSWPSVQTTYQVGEGQRPPA